MARGSPHHGYVRCHGVCEKISNSFGNRRWAQELVGEPRAFESLASNSFATREAWVAQFQPLDSWAFRPFAIRRVRLAPKGFPLTRGRKHYTRGNQLWALTGLISIRWNERALPDRLDAVPCERDIDSNLLRLLLFTRGQVATRLWHMRCRGSSDGSLMSSPDPRG